MGYAAKGWGNEELPSRVASVLGDKGMQRYILRRLVQTLVTIWIITLAVFMLTRITGDPVDLMLNPLASEHDRAIARKAWGQAIETSGVGLGCTLIWRRVLEAIPFRCDLPEEHANDWEFALDVKAAGFVQKHDLGVACGHLSYDVENAPVAYWPDPDGNGDLDKGGKGLFRVEAL